MDPAEYESVGTMATRGGGVKTLGCEDEHPLIAYPKEVGGWSNAYIHIRLLLYKWRNRLRLVCGW